MPSRARTDQTSNSSLTHRTTHVSRRTTLAAIGGTALGSLTGCLSMGQGTQNTFSVGVVLALSQGWEAYGNTMLRAVQVAIDEMEQRDVIDSQEISLVVEDTQVNPQTTRDKVTKLITEDNVNVIFGPISSTNRIAMAPLLEEHSIPGLYGVEYEGSAAEDYCNPWLFKTAEIPIQQINPFVPWLVDAHGSSFYLLGSDYIWPKKMNEATTTVLNAVGGSVVGEDYVPNGHTDFSSIIPRIQDADPDVLFMTLTGPSVPAIQEQMLNFGVRDQWTDVGISHGQGLLAGAPPDAVEGVVSCHAYLENLDNALNRQFVEAFQNRGDDLPITFLTGTARVAMSLLEQAIVDQGDFSADAIREGLQEVSTDTVVGDVSIAVDNQATLPTRATRVNAQKKHVSVAEFDAIEPDEYCDAI